MSKDVIDEMLLSSKEKLKKMTALELMDRMSRLQDKIFEDIVDSEIPLILCLCVLEELKDSIRNAFRKIAEE